MQTIEGFHAEMERQRSSGARPRVVTARLRFFPRKRRLAFPCRQLNYRGGREPAPILDKEDHRSAVRHCLRKVEPNVTRRYNL
jgi:hypothetical protein